MNYMNIKDAQQKESITRSILEALPEWFEIEEGREGYIRDSAEQFCFWGIREQ